jgi:hypothetical protein
MSVAMPHVCIWLCESAPALAALNLRRQDRKKSAAWHVGRQLAAKLVSSFLKRPYVGLSLTYPVDGSALLARLHALFRINW